MGRDIALQQLHDASPRREAEFDAWIDSLEVVRKAIRTTGTPARRRVPKSNSQRHRVGLSLAAGVLGVAIAVAVGLTLTATTPPSAYAAARKAIAATAAASSGTITGSVSHGGASYTLDTTRWNGDAIEVTPGDRSELGPIQALMLVNGGAYLQQADGTWLHYASASGVGPKVGPMVELAQNNIAGNTADQVLSLAAGITQTTQPDGSTLYTGTIPDTSTDTANNPNDDAILRTITQLTNGADNVPGAPGGYHDGIHFEMTAGPDGLVRQVRLTYQQQGAGAVAGESPTTWTISYSDLGTTPPIEPPTSSTLTTPIIWSAGPACTAPCGG
jgi:hypothetical protein